jgi:hypothetical protein
MEVPGSTATRDSNIISDIGMALFKELSVPIDDLRGMGIIMSKLNNGQNSDKVTTSAHGLANWLKKGKEIDEDCNSKGRAQQTYGCNADHTYSDLEMHEEIQSASAHHKESLFDKRRFINDRKETENAGGTIDDVGASLPRHFQRDTLSDDEDYVSAGGSDLLNLAARVENDPMEVDHTNHSAALNRIQPSLDANTLGTIEHITTAGDKEPRRNENLETSQRFTQIALPPLSQIRMSQVEALPSELQKQILSRIQGKEATQAASHHAQVLVVCIDVDDPVSTESARCESAEVDDERRNESGADNKIGEGHQQYAPLEQTSHRFRQTNLKRMMRLAAVKSGRETTDISLSQLEHLPLEIKLQVVNDDLGPVGALSPRRPQSMKEHPSTSMSNNRNALGIQPIDNAQEKVHEQTLEVAIQSHVEEKSGPAEHETATIDDSPDSREEPLLIEPVDVYQEDIFPLKLFLDENPPLDPEAMGSVVKFLVTCLKEGRLKDVVTLIRSIRNRQDDWSCKVVLEEIVRLLDETHLQQYGTRLDVDWLIGK